MKILKLAATVMALFAFIITNAQIMYEDFENGGNLPDGWITNWEGGSNAVFNWTCHDGGYVVPDKAHKGDYNAYLRNNNGSFMAGLVRLTAPVLDLSSYAESTVALSFWQTNTNDGSMMWNELKVYYKAAEGDNWTEILLIGNENSVWHKRTIVLPEPYTNDYWICFVGEETISNGICIDDVDVFEYFYPPQNLEIASGDNYTDLLWETPAVADGLTEYKIYRNQQLLTTISSANNSYTDNSVVNHQAYQYYVSSVYGANESYASNEVFDAPLGIILPYFEGFENDGDKPYGWSQVFELSEQLWVFEDGGRDGNPISAYEGDYNAILTKYSSWTGRKTRLISPKLNLSSYNNATLTFQMANVEDYAGNPDLLRVWYKNSIDGEWEQIEELDTQHVNWTEISIVLPNISDEYWIALEGYAYLGYGICVDNFTVTTAVSTNSVLQNGNVSIVPNPSNGIFTVNSLSEINNASYITVSNVFGQIVSRYNINNNNAIIDLTSEANGMYLLTIFGENDEVVLSEKIIKK